MNCKKNMLLFITLICTVSVFAQLKEIVYPRYASWDNGTNGFYIIPLPQNKNASPLPEEWNSLSQFNIYDIPFEFDPKSKKLFGSGKEQTGFIEFSPPVPSTEIFLVLNAQFPSTEKFGMESYDAPLKILSETERIVFEIEYSDGSIERLIPYNVDYNMYGITHGIALYSLKAKNGLRIAEVHFEDKMITGEFDFIAATANVSVPVFADPFINQTWYPQTNKIEVNKAIFNFETIRGLSWGKIRNGNIDIDFGVAGSPVFKLVINNKEFPSTVWKITNVNKNEEKESYIIDLELNDSLIKLKAQLKAIKIGDRDINLSLNVKNVSDHSIEGSLHFPLIEGAYIGTPNDTWYIFNRDGSVISQAPCSFHDYIGSEKPLQFDGIFTPMLGVGLAFFPKDTTDLFRWYNFSKDNRGINYNIEYAPETTRPEESWKCVNWSMIMVSGDWKDQFKEYKSWLATWYKPHVPRLAWFRKASTFVVDNAYIEKPPDFFKHANDFKNRWGNVDLFHVWGWSYTDGDIENGKWWGDYSHYNNMGGKKQLKKTISCFQKEMNIPFSLYVDAYLVSKNASNIKQKQKEQWAIINKKGEYIFPFNSYAMCPYVKEWRQYLLNQYLRLHKEFGLKAIYNDESGMAMRTRACYNKDHGHQVPLYQSQTEIEMLKELKSSLPQVAIFTELGATDVMAQFADGSFGYTSFWGAYTPRGWLNMAVHPSYNNIAPHYLHLRRFACPDFKIFELNMFETPWRDGNWYIAKFPFFNGYNYYHRYDDGVNADKEAVDFFKKVRVLQERYKNEFYSDDVEPHLNTIMPNTFVNRFSSPKCDVYTIYNAGYRTANGVIFKIPYQPGRVYRDVFSNRKVDLVQTGNEVALSFEIDPRSVTCIVSE